MPKNARGGCAEMAVQHVEPLSFGSVFSVVLGLLLVLGLLFAAAWLVRRLQQVQPQVQSAIQLVAQLPVGLKERLLVVRVGDENVLIGVAPGQIRSLHVWQGSVPVSASAPAVGPAFLEQLKTLMASKRAGQ